MLWNTFVACSCSQFPVGLNEMFDHTIYHLRDAYLGNLIFVLRNKTSYNVITIAVESM